MFEDFASDLGGHKGGKRLVVVYQLGLRASKVPAKMADSSLAGKFVENHLIFLRFSIP